MKLVTVNIVKCCIRIECVLQIGIVVKMSGKKCKVGVPGKALSSQSKEIVSNVYTFMKKESDIDKIEIPLKLARERTAVATGVSVRTVSRINAELSKLSVDKEEANYFSTPTKIRNRKKPVTGIDSFDESVVRRTVYDFYITEKRLPTIKLLQATLKDKIDYKGSRESVRMILKNLGFRWKRVQNNRRILIENSDIREKRISYLLAIKKYREEKRPIVYMDESYVCTSHVSGKTWADGSVNGLHTPISKGDRLIIVHAGGEEGFVPNAVAMWKAGVKSGDYHDNMNSSNFMQWVKNQLVPNLKPNTVLVVDNAKYHNSELDKAPTSKSKKDEMIEWLEEKNIPYDRSMLKPQLYKLIQNHKAQFKKYVLDAELSKAGHSVLRLPPYHPDLTPIELIWAEVKDYVATHNTTFKMADIRKLCDEKFSAMGPENWIPKCNHVKTIEEEYLKKEVAIDLMTEEASFVINLNSESGEDSDSEDDAMSGVEEFSE